MWYNMEEPKKKNKCLRLYYIIYRYRFYQKYMDIDYVESFSQKKKIMFNLWKQVLTAYHVHYINRSWKK